MPGVVNTTDTFTTNQVITSTLMNNIIDQTLFTSDAIASGNTTLALVAGKLKVGTITSNEMGVNSVTTNAIAANAVTTAKILDANVTTAKILDANVTPAKLSQPLTIATAQATTSGTNIDFTSIPNWVRRVTVMFNGVSTNGTSFPQVQVGSGSFTTSGYNSTATSAASTVGTTSVTSGFVIRASNAANLISGQMVLTLVSGNNWASSHMVKVATSEVAFGSGDVSLSATLDRVRITTVNGTDTFDAGSINIFYE